MRDEVEDECIEPSTDRGDEDGELRAIMGDDEDEEVRAGMCDDDRRVTYEKHCLEEGMVVSLRGILQLAMERSDGDAIAGITSRLCDHVCEDFCGAGAVNAAHFCESGIVALLVQYLRYPHGSSEEDALGATGSRMQPVLSLAQEIGAFDFLLNVVHLGHGISLLNTRMCADVVIPRIKRALEQHDLEALDALVALVANILLTAPEWAEGVRAPPSPFRENKFVHLLIHVICVVRQAPMPGAGHPQRHGGRVRTPRRAAAWTRLIEALSMALFAVFDRKDYAWTVFRRRGPAENSYVPQLINALQPLQNKLGSRHDKASDAYLKTVTIICSFPRTEDTRVAIRDAVPWLMRQMPLLYDERLAADTGADALLSLCDKFADCYDVQAWEPLFVALCRGFRPVWSQRQGEHRQRMLRIVRIIATTRCGIGMYMELAMPIVVRTCHDEAMPRQVRDVAFMALLSLFRQATSRGLPPHEPARRILRTIAQAVNSTLEQYPQVTEACPLRNALTELRACRQAWIRSLLPAAGRYFRTW